MKKRLLFILVVVAVLTLTLAACARNDGTYTVTFDAQNGTTPQVVKFDDNFTMPPDPVKNGKTFGGWYTDKAGNRKWIVPVKLTGNITVYAKWTTPHDFGDNYLMFVQCQDPNCDIVGRNSCTNSAKDLFVYNFNSAKQAEVESMYNNLVDAIGNANVDFDTFQGMFEAFDAKLSYVVEQYQYAYVFYCAYGEADDVTNYNYASQCYNADISYYYELFNKIHKSAFREQFFDGWTEAEIQAVLSKSDTYGNEEFAEISTRIDELVVEHDKLIAENAPIEQISAKYAELVPLNNRLAAIAGYDNYMKYAYAVTYGRAYEPQEVEAMRANVKKYIAPTMDKIVQFFKSFNATSWSGTYAKANYDYYAALENTSVFNASTTNGYNAVNLMGNYFKEMTTVGLEGFSSNKEMNFYDEANEIFKNGNYYLGKQTGAYTYYIGAQDTSILYFSNERRGAVYDYQTTATFVHEFGHYMNNVYNGNLDLSMDHMETMSQGNEMMFLAWLGNNLPKNISQGYTVYSYAQLADILSTILLATAVDEFEQAAYSGQYNGAELPKLQNGNVDYAALFEDVLSDYGESVSGNENYWSRVVFEQAGYYISYAMSALPCVELYVDAMQDFTAAKRSYFKLFTFSDDETLVDANGNVHATYSQVLDYCGLQDPLRDEALYQDVYNFFVN